MGELKRKIWITEELYTELRELAEKADLRPHEFVNKLVESRLAKETE